MTIERGVAPTRRGPARISFLRIYIRALRSLSTYDPRGNVGLWIGFVLALPIPLMAIALAAPTGFLLASAVAPLGWGVIVGAATQVGTLRDQANRMLRTEALSKARFDAATNSRLRSDADSERTQRREMGRVLDHANAELALAEIIHQGLISPDVQRGDVTVVVRHIPQAHVGGDYAQVLFPRPDLLYLCVADVAGHGVAAALVVSRLHSLFQRLILEQASPGAFLVELESATSALVLHTTLFATFAVFRINLAARRMEFATAGHPPQFLLRSGGSVEELCTPNGALGLQLPSMRSAYAVGAATYEPGDTLLLFTDGLFEVRKSEDASKLWGEAALKTLFARVGQGPPGAVADRILDAVREYRGTQPTDDDVTLLVARL